MTENTLLGLMLAMTALKGAACGHVATFVSDLAAEVQSKVLGLFQSQLMKIFADPEVCRWLAEHPREMHAGSLKLASHLCSQKTAGAYDILQLSRVCEMPPMADDFVAVCRYFLKSDKKGWVHECLLGLPSQQQVPFENFAELVTKLPQVRWRDVLEKNKTSMVRRPVVEWAGYLEKLTSEVSELKTDSMTREQVLQELANKFGPVNTMQQYQECMSPKSRTALVLGLV